MFFRNFEPFWDFVLPAAVKQWSRDDSSNWDPLSLLGQSVELEVATSLGLTTEQVTELEFDLRQAVEVRRKTSSSNENDVCEAEDDDSSCDTTERGKTVDLVSYMIGSALGRWDIRFATGEKLAPELPDPFAPLPVCPPGQLQNEQGLPITKEDVTWLKEEGCWRYLIEIPWDGILVDDPGHPLDLETRVHQVLQVIWKDRWEAIEREACEILGVHTFARLLLQARRLLRRPPEALLQESPQGADLLAVANPLRLLYLLALVPPPQRPDALYVRE
jgi:hypothetical protein